jgi:hypothetical protein
MQTYSFTVDNKEYTIKYNFNTICDLEEASNLSISQIFQNDRIGLNTVRLVIWAGLKWQDHGITKQRVGNILNQFIKEGKDYSDLVTKAAKLLVASVSNENMVDKSGE